MARDDYFVLAYRILKFLYECFKAGEKADLDYFGSGIVFPRAIGSARIAKLTDPRITQKGIEFLQGNSSIKKAVDFLTSAKEIVPGF